MKGKEELSSLTAQAVLLQQMEHMVFTNERNLRISFLIDYAA